MEETLEEWYQNKMKATIRDLILAKDEAILNDVELFRRALVLSLNQDLAKIQHLAQEYHLHNSQEQQDVINRIK